MVDSWKCHEEFSALPWKQQWKCWPPATRSCILGTMMIWSINWNMKKATKLAVYLGQLGVEDVQEVPLDTVLCHLVLVTGGQAVHCLQALDGHWQNTLPYQTTHCHYLTALKYINLRFLMTGTISWQQLPFVADSGGWKTYMPTQLFLFSAPATRFHEKNHSTANLTVMRVIFFNYDDDTSHNVLWMFRNITFWSDAAIWQVHNQKTKACFAACMKHCLNGTPILIYRLAFSFGDGT